MKSNTISASPADIVQRVKGQLAELDHMDRAQAYIGIGSNQGDPVSTVREAITCLDNMPDSEVTRYSSLYQSEPVSDIPQDDYVNAVAGIKTSLPPNTLLLELQSIEDTFCRRRDPALKWAPRTLDLDIVLYGNRIIDDSLLAVPHREMANRLFVLQPLLDITGDINIPGLGSLQKLIDKAPTIEISKIDA